MSALRLARWSALTALALGCAARNRAPAPVAVANAAAPDTAHAAPDTPIEPAPAAPRTPRVAARLAPCTPQRGAHAVPPANTPAGDPAARAAAQRGLAFVSREAVRWQTQHNCYGCHVQAVTFEALTVGREHRYDIADTEFRTVMRGLLDVPGGHRQPGGLSVGGNGEPTTSRTFGGAAFARYDASQGGELTDDLLAVAGQLQEAQQTDGHLQNDDTRFPVVEGPMQATTQALQTWRQAWARSADARWLAPMRRAEAWVQTRARALSDDPSAGTVPLNYAVMGLLAAGAQPSEAALTALAAQLRRRQREDGGWGYQPTGESNAFATGQTLHALRSLGASDDDAVVARGTRWLITHQGEDGGWSRGGSGKAEAMWAVFGLVSIDVMSASLEGLRDGEHVDGDRTLTGRAVDNNGAPVQQVDLLVDDVPVARACGSAVTWRLDSASLQPGVHTVDLVGTNARGQTTRRRVEVYAGAHYLVRAATQWRDGATEINLRNVAPAARSGSVRVLVRPEREGATAVWTHTQPAAQGPLQLTWNGRDTAGAAQPAGRYVAAITLLDPAGRPQHSLELPFVHEDTAARDARYGQVTGQLQAEGAQAAANAEVELVDASGRVVQRTMSNEAGNWRFRDVDQGQYRVRVRRAGFRAAEMPVSAAPARASSVGTTQLQLH